MTDEKKAISADSGTESPAPESVPEKYTMKQHWKCLAACTLMSLCPFQYGIDFGLIGGMQAMVGFLRVCPPLTFLWNPRRPS
jgi:MFS transporter, SP family, sugar:H+ symporter